MRALKLLIGCPLIVLHGSADELVPVAQGRKLCQAAREPKTFVEIAGAEIVDHGHLMPQLQQPVDHVRAYEPAAARDQHLRGGHYVNSQTSTLRFIEHL